MAILYPSLVEAAAFLVTFVTALAALIPRELARDDQTFSRVYARTIFYLYIPFVVLLVSILFGIFEQPLAAFTFIAGVVFLIIVFLRIMQSVRYLTTYRPPAPEIKASLGAGLQGHVEAQQSSAQADGKTESKT